MAKQTNTEKRFQDITIGVHDGHNRSHEKKARVSELALKHHQKRSFERLIKNEMLSICYRMEEYVNDQNTSPEEICTIKHFVTEFLGALNIKKTDFAKYIEIDMSNLNKYYNNERPVNHDLALKLGHFFHTPPDLWLKIQFKNSLVLFNKNKRQEKDYKKFDYEKMLQIA